MSRNSKIILGSIGGFILIVIIWFVSTGNTMMRKNQDIKEKWANVGTMYQRRRDVADQVVKSITASANFEGSTLQKVIEARNAAHAPIDENNLTPAAIQQFQNAQSAYRSAINVVVEQYPQLKTTDEFKEYMSTIEGSENRITKARTDFNEVVKIYNSYILTWPNSIVAGMKGYNEKGFFEPDAGAQNAPANDFSGIKNQ